MVMDVSPQLEITTRPEDRRKGRRSKPRYFRDLMFGQWRKGFEKWMYGFWVQTIIQDTQEFSSYKGRKNRYKG